jgi:hypothetical protein
MSDLNLSVFGGTIDRHMPDSKRPRVQRIGIAVMALPCAVFVLAFFWKAFGSRILAVLPIILVASWSGFYLLWDWIFFARPERVKKNVRITSKEWRRRQKEFYDSLPR